MLHQLQHGNLLHTSARPRFSFLCNTFIAYEQMEEHSAHIVSVENCLVLVFLDNSLKRVNNFWWFIRLKMERKNRNQRKGKVITACSRSNPRH